MPIRNVADTKSTMRSTILLTIHNLHIRCSRRNLTLLKLAEGSQIRLILPGEVQAQHQIKKLHSPLATINSIIGSKYRGLSGTLQHRLSDLHP